VAWVDTYLEDVRSDFSAIHRIGPDSLESLPASRAYALAYRINAYQGLIRGRWLAQEAEKPPTPSGPQQVKASEWLAQRPQVLDQISKTPIRKG
jgi:hypothetical protein